MDDEMNRGADAAESILMQMVFLTAVVVISESKACPRMRSWTGRGEEFSIPGAFQGSFPTGFEKPVSVTPGHRPFGGPRGRGQRDRGLAGWPGTT
ncbi:unnamed protein product [Boreogadus saida]